MQRSRIQILAPRRAPALELGTPAKYRKFSARFVTCSARVRVCRPFPELMAARIGRISKHLVTVATSADGQSLPQKSAIQTQIEELIALRPVVIFSKTTCPFSIEAKSALQDIGFKQAAIVELDRLDPPAAEEIQNHMFALTGARTVPRVFINRKCVGGGSDVAKLAKDGQLKSIVDDALKTFNRDLKGEGKFDLERSEDEWRKELSPEAYRCLRMRGTERPGSHEYDQFYPKRGYFACAACALPLYSASSKFESSCGWPVFDKCYHSMDFGCHIGTRPDGSGSLEIICPRCGSHLGHVFFDAHSKNNVNGERH